MRLIFVESDSAVRDSLLEKLREDGFDVDGVGSALEFYRSMATHAYDVAIIDADLPDETGLSIASWLSAKGNVGIVVTTSRGDLEDRIAIRRSGADLHLVKPVDREELGQALHNLNRRVARGDRRREDPHHVPTDWYFDPAEWAMKAPNGLSAKLTATEVKFIKCLLTQPGKAISREKLCGELGYMQGRIGDRNIEALVRRLRLKLETLSDRRAPIQTVHGEGYLFSSSVRLERRVAPSAMQAEGG